MRTKLMLGALALAAAAPALANASPKPSATTSLASPDLARAGEALRIDHERFVGEVIALAEIPSPPFGEGARAAAYAEMMRLSGLTDVRLDGIGNVIGVRRGRDRSKPPLVIGAHLDTVFPEGTDVRVRREGTRLFAPGIGDDARGLATLLAFARAMEAARILPDRDIMFVGTVGEEGAGNLRGVRFLFENDPRARTAAGFIAVDLNGSDRIVTRHVGSRRYRIIFTGPGGHSFDKFGIVNPAVPLAKTIAGLYAIPVPDTPRTTYSASMIGGGTSINAIPARVHVDIDIRSLAPAEIERIDSELRRIAEAATAAENGARSTEFGRVTVTYESIGDRPAATVSETSGLGAIAFTASRAEGFAPLFTAVSTDANLPASLGIPAIAIGTGGQGGGEHSPEEYIDVEIEESLRGLRAGLATILAAASAQSAL
ncbi:M20/M25/M40 family metallo-hydrolase [Sphingopyxis kveilinensis]|uniref:M20/M25/M40 family metallo-hydrolase n=1 Tax=Sphingopyxis kveilinensis TaxID=3114367 RepID=UPI0030D0F876